MPSTPFTIVLAEDHEIQRRLMKAVLNRMGHEVIAVEDGNEAFSVLRETNAQILISDLQMPGLDGIGLTRAVRALNLDRYVHIIMITGQEEDSQRARALEAGVDDFLSKGPNQANLSARIRAATRLIRREQELAERNRVLKEANDRIENDLRAAAIAQQRLLPVFHDDLIGIRIESAFVPSSFVSGDMYGCFPLSDHELGFYTVDVSGHGVHASLLSVAIGHLITPEYFRNRVSAEDGTRNPAALVEALNARFYSEETDEYFTMFVGILNTRTGVLDYCQAGHPSPYYIAPSGAARAIGDGGFPVGMLDFATFESKRIQVERGGTFVLCSDAAIEAENPAGELMGADRLSDIVSRGAGASASLPDTVVRALDDWRDGTPLEDDLTVVSLEWKNTHDSHHIA